jgi:hypothetical protein
MFGSTLEKTHIALCLSCLLWTCVVFEILFFFQFATYSTQFLGKTIILLDSERVSC